MISRFFIYRPIFASVVSIVIVIAGAVTLLGLPIAQYPTIAPPTIEVTAQYPGADALVIAETLGTPIEQEVNGVPNMLYMQSKCGAGKYTLTITFATGTNIDFASVDVQNRVATAMPKLPEEATRQGVVTKKKSPDFALMVCLTSQREGLDDTFLSNLATLRLRDPLARIKGVGDVTIFGAGDYSMRMWLDPEKLKARRLTTNDIVNAVREQNVQVAAGVIGQTPAPKGQAFEYTVTTQGRLSDIEQFENIVVKVGEEGRLTRVRDVARVELGAQNYNTFSRFNGEAAATLAIYQYPGANLLDISTACREVFEDLSATFPEGVEYTVAYDASDVVRASIKEIISTLLIATVLVILTVWIFLQDWRATIIPSVTIPVSLIGTFAVMGLLGFSINTLTLFGLVLAIGIVVDDAIVVVENVARNIDESGLSPKEATVRAMEEVTGPVVATTLVLLSVFVPTAFMGGLTGILYNQFGLTIATATVFSSINALTMSPALCGILMRKSPEKRNVFFRAFNSFLDKTTHVYGHIASMFIRRIAIAVLLFIGILVGAYFSFTETPTGFVPVEDQGYAMIDVQLPDAASMERTRDVVSKINGILAETEGVAGYLTIEGFSFIQQANSSNVAGFVITFDPWDERPGAELYSESILTKINQRCRKEIPEAIVVAFSTPALPGLGQTGGFELQVQDRGSLGPSALQASIGELMGAGAGQAGLDRVYSPFRANVPQLYVNVDREKAKTMDIPLQQVFDTLNAYLGAAYVNDFNKFGRIYQVNIQADAMYRAKIEDIRELEIRAPNGKMIPMGTLVDVSDELGPSLITRHNLYTAATVTGSAAPGFSSGEAMDLITGAADDVLPSSMGYEWTGLSYQEQSGGGQAAVVFGLAIIFVYLVLAAQYEAWSIPMAVILAVPMGILGAFLAVLARGLDNNLYTQVGLILLVGLVCKNAILIVEFARAERDSGKPLFDAALDAARLRFRPILMTALSFVLGVLPLLIATGAGAGSRRALGTAVFGGMTLATILGVLVTPALYVIVQGLSEKMGGGPKPDDSKSSDSGSTPPPTEPAPAAS